MLPDPPQVAGVPYHLLKSGAMTKPGVTAKPAVLRTTIVSSRCGYPPSAAGPSRVSPAGSMMNAPIRSPGQPPFLDDMRCAVCKSLMPGARPIESFVRQ